MSVWHVVYFDATLGCDLISRPAKDAKEAHDVARSLEHQGHAVVEVLELPDQAPGEPKGSAAYRAALRAVAVAPSDRLMLPVCPPASDASAIVGSALLEAEPDNTDSSGAARRTAPAVRRKGPRRGNLT